jgi:hypothetical protein
MHSRVENFGLEVIPYTMCSILVLYFVYCAYVNVLRFMVSFRMRFISIGLYVQGSTVKAKRNLNPVEAIWKTLNGRVFFVASHSYEHLLDSALTSLCSNVVEIETSSHRVYYSSHLYPRITCEFDNIVLGMRRAEAELYTLYLYMFSRLDGLKR